MDMEWNSGITVTGALSPNYGDSALKGPLGKTVTVTETPK